MAAGVVAKDGDKLVVCFLREDGTAEKLHERAHVRVYVGGDDGRGGWSGGTYTVKDLNRSLAGDATIVPDNIHKVLEQSVARQPKKT